MQRNRIKYRRTGREHLPRGGHMEAARDGRCEFLCTVTAKSKLAVRMLDHDDARKPAELAPHRSDIFGGHANWVEDAVNLSIEPVGRKRDAALGDGKRPADPQAAVFSFESIDRGKRLGGHDS